MPLVPPVGLLKQQLVEINEKIDRLSYQYSGNKVRGEVGVLNDLVTIGESLFVVNIGTNFSSYDPTPTHEEVLFFAVSEINELGTALYALIENEIKVFEQVLEK